MTTSTPKPNTMKTRILIISDTHTTPLAAPSSIQPFRQPLPKVDLLLHCGDLTMQGNISEYERTLDMLAKIDAGVKLVIAGNHDRTLDERWMATHQHHLSHEARGAHGPARELWFGEGGRARREGVRMLEEGVHEVELVNGAVVKLYTSEYQPEFYDWAFPYEKHQDRYNSPQHSLSNAENISQTPIPSFSDQEIDILMTHGPPYKRGDITRSGNVGCPHLLRAVTRAKPLIHCFGHIHEGWGAEVVEWGDKEVGEGEQVTMEGWKEGGWEKHVAGVRQVEGERSDRCVVIDAKEGGVDEIRRGRQTLMVNAAIMDERYKPINSPFLVELELPAKA